MDTSSQATVSISGPHPSPSDPPASHARVAGALGLAHVVLLLGGLVLSGGGALLEEGSAGVERAYRNANLTKIFGGWFIESIGFVLLAPVVVFLAHFLGRTTATGRWAARSGLVLATCYIAITLAVGFPAGVTSAHGLQQGLSLDAATALNAMRVFAYLLSLLCLGGHVICVAISALADGFGRRFVGMFGLVTGAGLCLATPLAAIGLQDLPTLVHLVWWIGLCVILLRTRSTQAVTSVETFSPAAAVRQA